MAAVDAQDSRETPKESKNRSGWRKRLHDRCATIGEVLRRTWFLGLTSFGGPAVHFQIFRKLFVEGKDPWLDDESVLVYAFSVPIRNY
jgi:hypothetical protein